MEDSRVEAPLISCFAPMIAPGPERRCAPRLKPPYDFVIRCNRVLRFERLPAAIQFGDIIATCVGRAGSKRNQFGHQFWHAHATLFGALLQGNGRIVINFDGLGLHAATIPQNRGLIQNGLTSRA